MQMVLAKQFRQNQTSYVAWRNPRTFALALARTYFLSYQKQPFRARFFNPYGGENRGNGNGFFLRVRLAGCYGVHHSYDLRYPLLHDA